MSLRIVLITVCLIIAGGTVMGADTTGREGPAPLLIADFEEPDLLTRIHANEGTTISLTDKDAVTGKRCLEVRVKPFSQHGNQWPYVFFIDKYFTTPIDLSRYSRVVASVRNVTEGLATVMFYLSSKPYNDGGRNLEGEGFVIPGGSTMQCALPTTLFRRPMNDPSTVQALMFVFPPNETDAIYRIDSIQAVYDPAVGSPAETLARELTAGAGGLLKQVQGLERQVKWAAVPADRAAVLRQRIPELEAAVRDLQRRATIAAREGWKGAYNTNRDAVDVLGRSLGEFALADRTGFHLWQRSRYRYVRRHAMPQMNTPAVVRLDLSMARNEFRDATFMVSAVDRDVALDVTVQAQEPGLAEAVEVRWSDFVQPKGYEEYGDVLVPFDGPLTIPRGESRELWATFDTRWHDVKPGRHALTLVLTDKAGAQTRQVPVTLNVWPFALPSYDVLPNNAYVEYHNSEIGAQVPEDGVRHMKRYGVNMTYVLPNELPLPVKLDEQGNLTEFADKAFTQRVTQMLTAWQAAPGQERLRWVFSLSGAPENMMADKSLVFLSDPWNRAFAQWLVRFKEVLKSAGVADDDWMFVLADESSESKLASYEIPFAEMIKRLDPELKITCNASQVISDKAMAERYFRVFDTLQPCLDSLKQSPPLRSFIGVNQRPLWTYRCSGMAGLDKDLYEYYRVYPWDNLRYGISGTGIWTYCAQGQSAWAESGHSLPYSLVFKHRTKPEVIHSRRYEFYREGLDDYRYVQALLVASKGKGDKAEREARALVTRATADITADPTDVTRCERWRLRLADSILKLQNHR